MTHYRWVITALIFLITFVNFVDRSAVSFVIGPFKEEFHFSDTQFGMILSAFGVGYIFSTVLGGWLIDRYGARRVWPLAAIGWSMCIGLFGLAGGFWGFISLRFLLGVSEGPHFPALGRTISDWLPAGERARALSLGLVAVPLSSVIGAPFCSYLVADWGWRAMFFVLSALGILWGFVWYALFRDKPADSPFVGKKERQLIRASQAPVKTQSRSDWRFILTHPALIANNIAYFAYAYMLFFTTLWLPGYFLSQYGLDLKSVGWYLTIPWLAAVVFLKAGGVLSDWLYRKRVARLHVVWSSQLISAVFFMLLCPTQTIGMAVFLLSLGLGFGMVPQSAFFSANIEIAQDRAGSAQGISCGWASLAGIASPVLTGFLIDLTGNYNGAFFLLAGLTLIGVVAVLACVIRQRHCYTKHQK